MLRYRPYTHEGRAREGVSNLKAVNANTIADHPSHPHLSQRRSLGRLPHSKTRFFLFWLADACHPQSVVIVRRRFGSMAQRINRGRE